MKEFNAGDAIKSIRPFNNGRCIVKPNDTGRVLSSERGYTFIQMNNGDEFLIKTDLMENFFIKKREEMTL